MLYWLPRVFGLLVAAFISVFATDVFSAGLGFWPTVAGLAMHLIPTAVVLFAVAIAWRWEAAGGLLLIAVTACYATWVLAGHHPASWILVVGGPVLVLGALFLLDWRVQHTPNPAR
jgi:hypothetical protein